MSAPAKKRGRGRRSAAPEPPRRPDPPQKIVLGILLSDAKVLHGQLWDYLYCFPRAPDPRFVVRSEKSCETSEVATEYLESYDAVIAKILLMSDHVEIGKTYDCWDDMKEDLDGDEDLPFNTVWAGSWPMYAVGTYESFEPHQQSSLLEEAITLMTQRCSSRGLCVFPPPDYVLQFARKVRYMTAMSELRTLPVNLLVPPTCRVPIEDRRWKHHVMDFLELYDVDRVMMKREISGRGNHVFPVSSKKTMPPVPVGSLEWMMQPYQEAFDRAVEFRMYVVMGKCQWGVATVKCREDSSSNDVPCMPVFPKTDLWEKGGGFFAASAAETFARSFAASLGSPWWLCSEPEMVWFLRVDMVAIDFDHSNWLLNELEFFGNADLHFECMKNAPDLFEDMRRMAQAYLGATFAHFHQISEKRQQEMFPELTVAGAKLEKRQRFLNSSPPLSKRKTGKRRNRKNDDE